MRVPSNVISININPHVTHSVQICIFIECSALILWQDWSSPAHKKMCRFILSVTLYHKIHRISWQKQNNKLNIALASVSISKCATVNLIFQGLNLELRHSQCSVHLLWRQPNLCERCNQTDKIVQPLPRLLGWVSVFYALLIVVVCNTCPTQLLKNQHWCQSRLDYFPPTLIVQMAHTVFQRHLHEHNLPQKTNVFG